MKQWQYLEQQRKNYLKKTLSEKILTNIQIDGLIDCAIDENSLTSMQYFISPCIKSIGTYEVSKKLIQKFIHGNTKTKAGILKAYYYVKEDEIETSNAGKNNQAELALRTKELLPFLVNCKNPILKFFFSAALPKDKFAKYYVGAPETDEELCYILKSSNDLENLEVLKEIFPQKDYDKISTYFVFIVEKSFNATGKGILLTKEKDTITKSISLNIGDEIKLILPDKSEINTKIKGVVFNKNQDILIEKLSPIPQGTEVFLIKKNET